MDSLSDDRQVVDQGQVCKAVHALYQYVAKKGNKTLIDGPQKINLQLTFKKASSIKKTIRIELPTSLVSKTSEVCLFVKDLDRKERDYSATVRHYKDLLKSQGIPNVDEVIPLKSLKTEYKSFESKRNLSNSFDVFLADERVVGLLPSLLGKHFYGRKSKSDFPRLEEADVTSDELYTVYTDWQRFKLVTVAHTDLTEQQAVNNVVTAAQILARMIPAGSANIKLMHLRTEDSPALTVYADLASSADVELPKKKIKLEMDEAEDVTTVVHGKVRVTPQGYVQVVNKASAAHISKAKEKRNRQRRKTQKRKTTSQKPPTTKKLIKVQVQTDSVKKETMLKSATKSRKRKLAVKTE